MIGQTYGTYRISEVLAQEPKNATAIGLLLLVAVVGKSAQFPLHTWLPDAMPGPTPITALIHAATMVAAGVYLVARLLPIFAASELVMTLLAIIAAITMLLGALFALVQTDLKRALAWSTVSQLAFMFAALSAGDGDAGTDHLLSHGAFKALLFLGCGCVMHAVGSSALSAMGGLRTAYAGHVLDHDDRFRRPRRVSSRRSASSPRTRCCTRSSTAATKARCPAASRSRSSASRC